MIKICKICGNEFIPTNNRAQCCPGECRNINHRRLSKECNRFKKQAKITKSKSCVYCGEEFIPSHGLRKTCDKCTAEYKRTRGREWHRKYVMVHRKLLEPRICSNCGKVFTPDILHPYQKFHEPNCQREFSHRKEVINRSYESKERRRKNWLEKKDLYKINRKKKSIIKICEFCGNPFPTHKFNQKCCNQDHTRQLQSQKRNAAKNNINSLPYTKDFIFQRDNYICYLCGEPLNMTAPSCEWDAPTIDHLIPIDHGGPDIPKNVKAAHFLCNVKKSNKDILIGGQLMFLFGERIAGGAMNAKKTPR